METNGEASRKGKRIASGNSESSSLSSSSADKVGCNDDLLSEILIRLPVRSVIRSKSVSKHWLSLITSRRFSALFCKQNPNPNPPSGLFCMREANDDSVEYQFVPFDINNPVKTPFNPLKFRTETYLIQSCNGLMLCSGRRESKYYVYNPTTNKVFRLPHESWMSVEVFGFGFVYDPSKSPHYKVLCIRRWKMDDPCQAVVDIYYSETHKWKVSGEPFKVDDNGLYLYGNEIYCNNAIHWYTRWTDVYYDTIPWYDRWTDLCCYKFDEECFHRVQFPVSPYELRGVHQLSLFESCGSLFFIGLYSACSAFEIYELKKDYSGWFVRYQVDIDQVVKAFPVEAYGRFQFEVQSFVLGRREEDSFIVLELPGKSIRYNLMSKTFCKLGDLIDHSFSHMSFNLCVNFIESLAEVS